MVTDQEAAVERIINRKREPMSEVWTDERICEAFIFADQIFYRWLAAHDAQVLRTAALSGDFGTGAQSTLLRRANQIANGESEGTT